MMGTNRTLTMARDLMNISDPLDRQARIDMGIGLDPDPVKQIGQAIGTIGSDLTQDRSREFWWLINAPQAVANVALETSLKKAAPGLYEAKVKDDKYGQPIRSKAVALKEGLIDAEGNTRRGITRRGGEYLERQYEPGNEAALYIAPGIAVNAGIGLLNPFGGQEGYKAVFESEEDPSKTSNVLGEIAAKYILGKTGNLLAWDDFKKVRPDVSKDEYMRYKAFKFDNDLDLNPLDGDLVGPAGVVKYTSEGIHGPEVQFLGRSLPLSTGILPAVSAITGAALGARRGTRDGRRTGVRDGLIGGFTGLGSGGIVGTLIENERRKRNAEENEREQQY